MLKKIIISSGWNLWRNFFRGWTFATCGGSKHFSCFYDVLSRELINSCLNNGLAATALSVAVHIHVCIIYCVCVHVCVSGVWTWGPGGSWYKILVWLTTPARSPKDYFFIWHKTSTIWTHFAVRLIFLITKFNESNPGHSKLRLLLKYLFVKSQKNRLLLCTLTPDLRSSFGFAIFRLDFVHFGLKFIQFYVLYFGMSITSIKWRWWTPQLVSTTFGNFFKNTFGSRSW